MNEIKRIPDWEKIEADYRAGVKTLRQIADEHGITHQSILKRARKQEWNRDIAAKVRARAEELVTRSGVTKAVTKDAEVIEANAQAITQIVLGERRDVAKAREIVRGLLEEFEGAEINLDDGVKNLRGLCDALKSLTELERRVYRIDGTEERTDALTVILNSISQGNFSTLPIVE